MSTKLLGPDRLTEARRLRQRYDAGDSIRGLVEHTGRSYCYVRDLLKLAGTDFRPRGFDRQFHQR